MNTVWKLLKVNTHTQNCCFVCVFPAGGARPQLGLHVGGRSHRSELRAAKAHRDGAADPLPAPDAGSAEPVPALGPLRHPLRLVHHPDITSPRCVFSPIKWQKCSFKIRSMTSFICVVLNYLELCIQIHIYFI